MALKMLRMLLVLAMASYALAVPPKKSVPPPRSTDADVPAGPPNKDDEPEERSSDADVPAGPPNKDDEPEERSSDADVPAGPPNKDDDEPEDLPPEREEEMIYLDDPVVYDDEPVAGEDPPQEDEPRMHIMPFDDKKEPAIDGEEPPMKDEPTMHIMPIKMAQPKPSGTKPVVPSNVYTLPIKRAPPRKKSPIPPLRDTKPMRRPQPPRGPPLDDDRLDDLPQGPPNDDDRLDDLPQGPPNDDDRLDDLPQGPPNDDDNDDDDDGDDDLPRGPPSDDDDYDYRDELYPELPDGPPPMYDFPIQKGVPHIWKAPTPLKPWTQPRSSYSMPADGEPMDPDTSPPNEFEVQKGVPHIWKGPASPNSGPIIKNKKKNDSKKPKHQKCLNEAFAQFQNGFELARKDARWLIKQSECGCDGDDKAGGKCAQIKKDRINTKVKKDLDAMQENSKTVECPKSFADEGMKCICRKEERTLEDGNTSTNFVLECRKLEASG